MNRPPTQRLRTIKRSSLADEVTQQLRSLIELGGYATGDRLPSEAQLTEQLGVGRNVLREAVGRLESLGMIQVQRGRGMFVGDRDGLTACAQLVRSAMAVSSDDLSQVAELRVAVECHAVRKVAAHATAEDIRRLETALAKVGDEGVSDEASIRADWAFHMQLIEIGCGSLLVNLMAIIQEFLIAGILKEPGTTDRLERMHGHDALLDAIRRRDVDRAEQSLREHVEGWSRRL